VRPIARIALTWKARWRRNFGRTSRITDATYSDPALPYVKNSGALLNFDDKLRRLERLFLSFRVRSKLRPCAAGCLIDTCCLNFCRVLKTLAVGKPNRTPTHAAHSSRPELRLNAGRENGVPVYRLIAPQILTSVCSILHNLHVVNFSHLDGLVLGAYDWSSLDQFPDLIEGAELDGE